MRSLEEIALSQAVAWAYRLFLNREAESQEAIDDHVKVLRSGTVSAIRERFIASLEFRQGLNLPHVPGAALLQGAIAAFRDPADYPSEAGFYRDVFGIRTRVAYLPPVFARYSGGRAGEFGIDQLPLHETAELLGMFEAASAATGCFTVMELGAGWGPWVSLGAALARRRGMAFRLIAVEGAESHAAFIDTHLRDNGIDPADHRVIHGIVGAMDGVAYFERLDADEYGATATSEVSGAAVFDEVRSYKISSLLENEPIIDVIHCDIQGHETDALGASIEALDARARRVIVGTHGRTIEHQLHMLFSSHGWRLSQDLACLVNTNASTVTLLADGCQVWINDRM